MIKVKRLGHATYSTTNIDRQIAHYCEVVGLYLIDRDADHAYLGTNAGQLAIVLEKGSIDACTRISFEVSQSHSFDEMSKFLSSHGIASARRSHSIPGLADVLCFTDPKGTVIELFCEPRFVAKGPFIGGAVTQKLGHLAFVVADPRAMAEFYQNILGFRISDWIGDFFVFLRCGADHHTVNFIQGPKVKMHHIAFEMRDTAHLHNILDQLGQKRVEIIWGPVRHGAGHNIAAYHFDPDGQMIEFYSELDRMSDEENGFFDPRPWHRDLPQRPKIWDPTKQRDMWGLPPSEKFREFVRS